MSTRVYLHHYPASLFSEKIRLMLGYLSVPWHSVEIPSVMPRPLLMPLTGGYRKTPTLQIGANVSCDTAVISTALARHTGDRSLFAPGFVAQRLAEWADSTLFRTTVSINFRPEAIGAFMGQLTAEEVAAFQADRAELAGGAPIVSLPPDAAIAAFLAYLDQLEHSVERAFFYGDAPSVADFAVYHCLWFVRQNPVNAGLMEPYPSVNAWYERMAAFGHGEVTGSSPEAALEHARVSEPELPDIEPLSVPGIELGTEVTVTPTDYGRIPVQGRLLALGNQEVVLERETPETGRLMTHFPLIGFEVRPA